jgi:hypothetical protein
MGWKPKEEQPEESAAARPVLEVGMKVATAVAPKQHVHEWTQISPRKRKCKPCGAVEISE